MAKFDINNTFKRRSNTYRLVITNDDTYDEILALRLSRKSVYLTFSISFILLVGLTIALIAFTPLKYYVPGYGSQSERRELTKLKLRADSLEKQMLYREAYWENVRNVLSGKAELILDTAVIAIPELEEIKD